MTFHPVWYRIISPDVLDSLLVFLAEAVVFAVPAALLGLWSWNRAAKLDAAFVLAAVLASLAISYGLGLLYVHPPPYQVRPDTVLTGPPENAFPSQHATVCFGMVWPLMALGRRRLSMAFLLVAVLVSAGRVATGLHYPVDVLGSVLASLLGFGLAWYASDAVTDVADRVVDLEARAWSSFLDALR